MIDFIPKLGTMNLETVQSDENFSQANISASASRSMPPASMFRHPVSQSATGAFRYRTGFPYSGIGLVPASAFLFIPVPD
jgi:hypothetical protein